MCKCAVTKLPYLLRYVPDQRKTQQMCDKAISENGGTLFLTTTKIKKYVIKQLIITLMRQNLFLKAIRLKKMCDEAFNKSLYAFFYILDQ